MTTEGDDGISDESQSNISVTDSSSLSENATTLVQTSISQFSTAFKTKGLGTTIDIEHTGTEDIPSCRSFTTLGLISVVLIIIIIVSMIEKASHYIPDYSMANRTEVVSEEPSTVIFFNFDDPRFASQPD